MIQANMHDAKSRLSQLVMMVEMGRERVVLCRNGTPVAELVSYREKKSNRLRSHPILSQIKIKYDPMEPLQDDELPSGLK